MTLLRPILLQLCFCAALCTLIAAPAFAGPPYMTDDPDPVPYHHWEFYTFAAGDKVDGANTVQGPAIEVNNGVAPNLQLHLIVPYTSFIENGHTNSGLGDLEAGVKYRFLTETKTRPEIGIFPLAELGTGDASQGLGNGRTWYKLSVWIQKSSGPWTTDVGGGYAINSEPGQRNYYYGGLLVQRTLNARLSLGGEIFLQGATADSGQVTDTPIPAIVVPGARASQICNLGGVYNFTPDFSLLFSAGHSYQGDSNSVFYVSLYRTWGPGAP